MYKSEVSDYQGKRLMFAFFMIISLLLLTFVLYRKFSVEADFNTARKTINAVKNTDELIDFVVVVVNSTENTEIQLNEENNEKKSSKSKNERKINQTKKQKLEKDINDLQNKLKDGTKRTKDEIAAIKKRLKHLRNQIRKSESHARTNNRH